MPKDKKLAKVDMHDSATPNNEQHTKCYKDVSDQLSDAIIPKRRGRPPKCTKNIIGKIAKTNDILKKDVRPEKAMTKSPKKLGLKVSSNDQYTTIAKGLKDVSNQVMKFVNPKRRGRPPKCTENVVNEDTLQKNSIQ